MKKKPKKDKQSRKEEKTQGNNKSSNVKQKTVQNSPKKKTAKQKKKLKKQKKTNTPQKQKNVQKVKNAKNQSRSDDLRDHGRKRKARFDELFVGNVLKPPLFEIEPLVVSDEVRKVMDYLYHEVIESRALKKHRTEVKADDDDAHLESLRPPIIEESESEYDDQSSVDHLRPELMSPPRPKLYQQPIANIPNLRAEANHPNDTFIIHDFSSSDEESDTEKEVLSTTNQPNSIITSPPLDSGMHSWRKELVGHYLKEIAGLKRKQTIVESSRSSIVKVISKLGSQLQSARETKDRIDSDIENIQKKIAEIRENIHRLEPLDEIANEVLSTKLDNGIMNLSPLFDMFGLVPPKNQLLNHSLGGILCKFALVGTCNDQSCRFVHPGADKSFSSESAPSILPILSQEQVLQKMNLEDPQKLGDFVPINDVRYFQPRKCLATGISADHVLQGAPCPLAVFPDMISGPKDKLREALHTMSRELEENPKDELMWCKYFKLYSFVESIGSAIVEQALKFHPFSARLWQIYVDSFPVEERCFEAQQAIIQVIDSIETNGISEQDEESASITIRTLILLVADLSKSCSVILKYFIDSLGNFSKVFLNPNDALILWMVYFCAELSGNLFIGNWSIQDHFVFSPKIDLPPKRGLISNLDHCWRYFCRRASSTKESESIAKCLTVIVRHVLFVCPEYQIPFNVKCLLEGEFAFFSTIDFQKGTRISCIYFRTLSELRKQPSSLLFVSTALIGVLGEKTENPENTCARFCREFWKSPDRKDPYIYAMLILWEYLADVDGFCIQFRIQRTLAHLSEQEETCQIFMNAINSMFVTLDMPSDQFLGVLEAYLEVPRPFKSLGMEYWYFPIQDDFRISDYFCIFDELLANFLRKEDDQNRKIFLVREILALFPLNHRLSMHLITLILEQGLYHQLPDTLSQICTTIPQHLKSFTALHHLHLYLRNDQAAALQTLADAASYGHPFAKPN